MNVLCVMLALIEPNAILDFSAEPGYMRCPPTPVGLGRTIPRLAKSYFCPFLSVSFANSTGVSWYFGRVASNVLLRDDLIHAPGSSIRLRPES